MEVFDCETDIQFFLRHLKEHTRKVSGTQIYQRDVEEDKT